MSTSAKDILQRHRLSVDEYHRMARAGVPEVWLVDLQSRTFTHHREPGPEGYRRSDVLTVLTQVTLPTPARDELDLSGLF